MSSSPGILTVGDNVVDRYVDEGFMYPGGNAVNVAVHARRLGSSSAYLGALGTDVAGQAVLAALQAEGVDTRLVRVVDGPNASADVQVVEGNRVFGAGRPGVSHFTLTPDDLTAAGAYAVVHTGECSHLEEQLATLHEASVRLSFDFSERPWDYVEEHAQHADIATVSCVSGDRDDAERMAKDLHRLGPVVVAVTLGADGALLSSRGDLHHAPAGDVQVVDTLGAGDAFIARLLHGLVRDEPAAQIVAAATAYASATCTSYGAFGHQIPLLTNPALSGTAARWESS